MLIRLECSPFSLYDWVHELVRMAFPGSEVSTKPVPADISFKLDLAEDKERHFVFRGEIAKVYDCESSFGREQKWEMSEAKDGHNQLHRAFRRFVFDFLCLYTGKRINSYGILTGMRPVKLVRRFLEQGLSNEQVCDRLIREYRVSPDKARLLVTVALNSASFLPGTAARQVSVYIGIPFCPSRCYYCSFPGAVLTDYERDIPLFIEALFKEIQGVGECLRGLRYQVQTVYIGGGTPTVLRLKDFSRLLELIKYWFVSGATEEITVEAGRPDTLNRDFLRLFKEAGINRVCINPQTMKDSTLEILGRKHSSKDVAAAVDLARTAGIAEINMDMILGLPGETEFDNLYTATEILRLQPENITLHTLAVKRGSQLAEQERTVTEPGNWCRGENEARLVEQVMQRLGSLLPQAGYLPYYLYRQKYMRADVENVGWARPGSFCQYNINMIEECQTVLGLGGGAASKFIGFDSGGMTVSNNPKNPAAYLQSINGLIARKVDNLTGLN